MSNTDRSVKEGSENPHLLRLLAYSLLLLQDLTSHTISLVMIYWRVGSTINRLSIPGIHYSGSHQQMNLVSPPTVRVTIDVLALARALFSFKNIFFIDSKGECNM